MQSPPSSSVHGILQAQILNWVAIPFSRGSSQPRHRTPGLPHCTQVFFFFFSPSEPPGKPRDTGWPRTIPVYLLKRKKPCSPAHHLIFIGFCILIFLFSSCPSLGAVILCRMVAFLNLFSQAKNMIVNIDLDNIFVKMPRSQPADLPLRQSSNATTDHGLW